MSSAIDQFDNLLAENGPAAIAIKQQLKPVGSKVFFPPTYASPENSEEGAGYCIDRFDDGTSCCVIDSIPSQANRIEPAFADIENGKLVPRILIAVKSKKGEMQVDLLSLGHRAADAVVRFSTLAPIIAEAIDDYEAGNALTLAKVAPTSLVFGFWDSRRKPTVKVPRLINSIIRAYGIKEYTRKAQYIAGVRDFEAAGVVKEKGDKELSEVGMADVPAPEGLGGIEARDGIFREASFNLCTLRDMRAATADETRTLQRYILGLSLVAITHLDGKSLNLRQGCQLVGVPGAPMTRTIVNADGSEGDFPITRDSAVAYAAKTSQAFGVGSDRLDVKFDASIAKKAIQKEKPKGKTDEGATV